MKLLYRVLCTYPFLVYPISLAIAMTCSILMVYFFGEM